MSPVCDPATVINQPSIDLGGKMPEDAGRRQTQSGKKLLCWKIEG